MAKYCILITGIVALAGCALATTVFSGTKHLKNVYGIQNVKTGKGLRPYNAYWWVGNRIILHRYKNWKCMTWQFTEVEKNVYQLQNLSTKKTFEPASGFTPGATLWQQRPNNDSLQHWQFVKQENDTWLIKLKGTEMYLTISSAEENSSIVLMPYNHSQEQQWRLIEQHPRI